MTYNPNQPRDKDGEWTGGGSKSTTSVKSEGTHARKPTTLHGSFGRGLKEGVISTFLTAKKSARKDIKREEEMKDSPKSHRRAAGAGALVGGLAGTAAMFAASLAVVPLLGAAVSAGIPDKKGRTPFGKAAEGFKHSMAARRAKPVKATEYKPRRLTSR